MNKRVSTALLALLCALPTAVAAEDDPMTIRKLVPGRFFFCELTTSSQRVMDEMEIQGLMDPVWKTPELFPKRTGVAEWGWQLRPDGGNKRQCYEWVRRWFEKQKAEKHTPGTLWMSHTGHEWFSAYGAEFGADVLALEVGENIVATQAQIALMRGAARLHRIPFFYDVSPWFLTIAAYRAGVGEEVAADPSEPLAEKVWGWSPYHYNGGHSSSLLNRLWYVGWLSGASYVYPEGAFDNFFARDLSGNTEYVSTKNIWVPKDPEKRAVLSPVGERAREFMKVIKKHPDVGTPHTPFLLMLDHFAGLNGYHYLAPRPWQVLPATEGDREALGFLDMVFPSSMHLDLVAGVNDDWYNPAVEHRRLVRSPWGDSFDIMLSPRPHGALGQEKMTKEDPLYPDLKGYQATINSYPALFLIGDHEFPFETLKVLAAYLKAGRTLFVSKGQAAALDRKLPVLASAGKLEVYEPKQVPAILDRLAKAHLPFEITGNVQYLINRTGQGWVIGLINNEGVTKEPRGPVVIDPSKKQQVTVRLRKGAWKQASEWVTDAPLKAVNNKVSLTIPPGEVRILECLPQ